MQSGRVRVTMAVGFLLLSTAPALEAQVAASTQDAITPTDCLGEPSKAPLCQAQGLLHVAGTGVPQDVGKGLALLDASCRAGLASGCRQHGWYLLKLNRSAEDVERGAAILQTACAGRDADACAVLGSAYSSGVGAARNAPKAVDLLGQACDLKHSWACTALAGLLSGGEGIPRDGARAQRLLVKACALGATAVCERICSDAEDSSCVLWRARPDSVSVMAFRISAIGHLQKLNHVQPKPSNPWKMARGRHAVQLELLVSTDGTVKDIKVIQGAPGFTESVIEAVRQWRYEPPLLDGVPVALVVTTWVNLQVG